MGIIRRNVVGLEHLNYSKIINIIGPNGAGKKDTTLHYIKQNLNGDNVIVENANKLKQGYFAGFYSLLNYVYTCCNGTRDTLIEKHEKVLCRLFPDLTLPAFKGIKDLTNTADRDERTRFYHHEFQEKLLNGIYEFLVDFYEQETSPTYLIIDEFESASPTINSLMNIINRRGGVENLNIFLLSTSKPIQLSDVYTIEFKKLSFQEVNDIYESELSSYSREEVDAIYKLSDGNHYIVQDLIKISDSGIKINYLLSLDTHIDFYLSSIGRSEKYNALKEYISAHCCAKSAIDKRNYQISNSDLKDMLHRHVLTTLKNTNAYYLHVIHAESLSEPTERLTYLAPIAIKLQEVGLYDTWFDFFSKYYVDQNLRSLGDGNEDFNSVYIRMAFILYSMGLAKLSIPYLDDFYRHFPESMNTPMVLYSQSMTYGRYQVPVQLDKAEALALQNLEKIDSIFCDHPKYDYLKVFAENALAYIRARQGRFEEALQLCVNGLSKMEDIYGSDKYKLHQSILIYNTGQVYEIMRDFENAQKYYQWAIDLDPNYGEYYNDIANLYANHGRYELALENYHRAIDLCPPYYEAHHNRACLYIEMEEYEKAERDLRRSIELRPEFIDNHSELARVSYLRGQFSACVEQIDKALSYDSHNSKALSIKALALLELDDIKGATDIYQALVAQPYVAAEVYSNYAILLDRVGQSEIAIEYIDKAFEMENDVDYLINKGMILQGAGNVDGAKAVFHQCRTFKNAPNTLIDELIAECH